MINGINHVGIVTADLERMVGFYRDILGFEVCAGSQWKDSLVVDSIIGVPNSAARSVVLSAGNIFLELFQYLSPPTPVWGPLRQPFERGYTHICLDVSDIDAECARLQAAGIAFNRAPPHAEMSGLKAIYGRDPDGNIIELQETIDNTYGISMSGLPHLRRNRSDITTEQGASKPVENPSQLRAPPGNTSRLQAD